MWTKLMLHEPYREVSVDRNTATETQTLKYSSEGRKTGQKPKKNYPKPRKPTETQGPCPDLRGFCMPLPYIGKSGRRSGSGASTSLLLRQTAPPAARLRCGGRRHVLIGNSPRIVTGAGLGGIPGYARAVSPPRGRACLYTVRALVQKPFRSGQGP